MSFYSSGIFNPYASKKQNSSVGVDFSYLNTADDVVAPTSDEFDSELDALIESIDIDQLTAPTTTAITNPFQFRSSQFDNSFSCAQGPASAFTFSSSESSYDSRSVSGRSQSSYNAYSPRDTTSNYSFPLDLDTEFQRFAVDGEAALDLSGLDCVDPTTFNMPTEPKRYNHRSSFSDYGPSTGGSPLPNEFFNQLVNYGTSPSIDTLNLTATSIPLVPFSTDDADKASRKKFKCTMCTRAFDRAFNLKTHMETHNPNRVKAYVCTHGSCGRAFSRKHDLGRHVTSIHRNADATDKAIGVGKGAKRCDNCGGGSDCDCAEAGAEREHRKVQVE